MLDMTLSLISILLWPLASVVIFAGRHWIIAHVSKGVEHRFNQQIEELRSRLRDREAEITALRNSVLAGSASRQALLDKRRFDAVERVWTAVNDLAPLKGLAQTMALLNFKAVAERATDTNMQTFLALVGTGVPDVAKLKNVARDERPFLPEPAWAYFAAYQTILMGSYSMYAVLKSGVENPEELLKHDAARRILKAALPGQSDFIDKNEPGAYYPKCVS